ncbi:phosphohydrolase [Paraliobacillus quinghaiensis]|uniref:Phosphohydrolase n=1 Tax=Paraliobacillus quinghaiensis TaxID=470815 RepID=A0A917TJN1_9BACI|nr:HD domain-containing protein [Paraliobacillus quinghaiensis]GGM23244.1 phosphohydrolase [Paraliobacillus quinghaiensis]
MKNNQILALIENYIYQRFNTDTTGHDYYHMRRVAKMANYLAIQEQIDPFLCEIAGWVHDIGDDKLTTNPKLAIADLSDFLSTKCLIHKEQIKLIVEAIDTVSFRKGKSPTTDIGAVVQDADRLDAIGAIGIARAFAYGGSENQPLFSEDKQLQQISTIQHFSDKLLHLKDRLNTATGKKIAIDRHLYMEQFLETFKCEWYFNSRH